MMVALVGLAGVSLKPTNNKDIEKIESFRAKTNSKLVKDLIKFKSETSNFIAQKGFVMGNLYSLATPRSKIYTYTCDGVVGKIQLTPAQAETYNATFRLKGTTVDKDGNCNTSDWKCRLIKEQDDSALLKELAMTMSEN